MKISRAIPTQDVIKRHKGHVDIYYDKRRGWVARSWPRPVGKNRSPAVQAQMALFKKAVAMIKVASPQEARIVQSLGVNTGFMPRDILMTAAFGNLIQWTTKDGKVRKGPKFT